MGRTACTEPRCLYHTAITLLPLWAVRHLQSLSACTIQLYLYPPYETFGLYRGSVPVQYSYTNTPLSACTVQLYLHSPYGPYCLYRTSESVQYRYTSTPPMGRTACTEPQCMYSTAIPPLPLWAVRPVQSLRACTVQIYLYFPQCLYSTAIPLLPLWAVRPLKSLSACTVQLYLYSPYGTYGL